MRVWRLPRLVSRSRLNTLCIPRYLLVPTKEKFCKSLNRWRIINLCINLFTCLYSYWFTYFLIYRMNMTHIWKTNYLQVSPENSNCRFVDVMSLQKVYVKRPYTMMLSDRQCSERTIENLTSTSYIALLSHQCTIIHPNTWHFVHKHQGSFEGVVDILVKRICYAPTFQLTHSLSQVIVP